MSSISVKPNIFSYAAGELAQDAFLCWLLEWSKESNKAHNIKLNAVALSFVKKLLDLPDNSSFSVNKIKILRQKYKIDVLAEVNDKYIILIEDKVKTKPHGTQLIDYAKTVKKHYKSPQWEIKMHYLKSYLVWNDERNSVKQANDSVVKANYKVFDIYNFAEFLESRSTVTHDTYLDFRQTILDRRDRYLAYSSTAPNKWHIDTWYSFLFKLQEELGYGKFGSHHTGKPYWFVLTWLKDYATEGSHISLEFHSGRLIIKSHIKDSKTDKRKIRTELIERLRTIYGSNGANVKFKIVGGKGKLLGNANSMALLQFTDYFEDKTGDDGIDFKKTCAVINKLNTTFNQLDKP